MLIALCALANLPIFRKPSLRSASSSRSGKAKQLRLLTAEKSAHSESNLPKTPQIDAANTSSSIRSNMSSNIEQEQVEAAANGNKLEGVNDVEVVTFTPHDKQSCRVIKTNRTKVYTCGGTHGRGSSKVKLKNVVDYKWERKYYYPGHLVAVHRDGKHLAYAINVHNKANGMEGVVRVCNLSSSLRALIKGMNGEVLDLQFAHTERERILAVIDMTALFVYKIDLIDNVFSCNLVLKIEDPIANYVPNYDMLSWCPYVSNHQGTPDDDDDNQLLIWSRSTQFQCFHVKMIVSEHGRGKIHPAALETGYLKIEEDSLITCTALSPDGTTVAAACADGLVRFYQIYLFDVRNHRCLHEWKPHDGKLVSSLFFLDNINKPVEDAYWQHVITTSDCNTEIKLWNCSLWECLQTINIVHALPSLENPPFIAGIDRSANYLIISCMDSLAVYVMQISNNNNKIGSPIDNDELDNSSASGDSLVRIENIAEFKLSSGILSFSIVNASMRRLKNASENYAFEEPDEYDDENSSHHALVLHMFVVQMKSLQECQIIYQPCVADKAERSLNNSSSSTNKSIKRSQSPDNSLLMHINDIKQEPLSSPNSSIKNVPLDTLFSKSKRTPSATASSSAVVAVAAAAAAAPSAVLQEAPTKSRSASPQYAGAYPQLNLMTPDAFSASSTAPAAGASQTANSGGTTDNNSTAVAPDKVNSRVLNTLRMLATVTGQNTEKTNLLNLMHNTLIEGIEHQKLKDKMEAQKKFISIDRNPERNAAENLASGGSSPSREVQEIMATQEDADAYEAELENLDDDEANSSPLEEEIDVVSVPKWLPEAPKLAPVKKSAELQNAANIMSQAVHASSSQHKNNANIPPTLGGGSCSNNSSSANNTTVTLNSSTTSTANDSANAELSGKMDQLMDLIKSQSQQINKLERTVTELQQSQKKPPTETRAHAELAYQLEMQLSKFMEHYLKRYEIEQKRKFDEFMLAHENQNRELSETLVQVLNQYVMNHFTDIIGNVLLIELSRQVLPRVNAKMDQLQTQIQAEIVQKLSAFDNTVKDNIAQVCKSKQFLDTFGKSVLVGVQTSLQTAFIESMSSTLIPAYEKSSQNMFKQLHDAFSVGLKDFMVQFNAYIQHIPQAADNSEEMYNKLCLIRQHIDTNLNKHRTALTDTMLETQREVKSLEILLARQVQETIRTELRKCFDTQNLAMRSQAATPAPTYDTRENIKQLLHAGQINTAFYQALLANDLNLVEFTLRHTDQTQAFAPDGCRLEQKVLLSLIQQISADMSNHNELKQSYLNEALLAINLTDPIAREHAGKVLPELYRNCQMFIKQNPKNSQCSHVRLLMKAVMTYRDQFK